MMDSSIDLDADSPIIVDTNLNFDYQNGIWTARLQEITEQFTSGNLNAAQTKVQLTKLYEEIDCCPSVSNIPLQLVVIFNLQTLSASDEFYISMDRLEKSLCRIVDFLDPTLRISKSASLWVRLENILRCFVRHSGEMSDAMVNLTLGILTSCLLLDRNSSNVPEILNLASRLYKQEHKPGTVNRRILNRFTPLETSSCVEHAADLFLLNSVLLDIKYRPANTQLKDIRDLFNRNGLKNHSGLFLYMESLLNRVQGKKTTFQKCLATLLDSKNSVPKSLKIEGWMLKGMSFCDQGSFQLALSSFYKVLQLSPGSVQALIGAQKVYTLTNNLRCEIETLRLIVQTLSTQTVSDKPDYLTAVLSSMSTCKVYSSEVALHLLGDKLLLAGENYNAAQSYISCLDRIERKSSTGNQEEVCTQEVRLGAALALLYAGNPSEAITMTQYMDSVISRKRKIDARSLELFTAFINGRAYADLQQYSRSLHFFERAMRASIPQSVGEYKMKRFQVPVGDQKQVQGQENNTPQVSREDTQSMLSVETLTSLRARLYLEKSKVYAASGDSRSSSQCLSSAVSLRPTFEILDAYKRDLECKGEKEELQKIEERGKGEVEEDLLDNIGDLDTVQICLAKLMDKQVRRRSSS